MNETATRANWTTTTLGPLVKLQTGKLDVNAGTENGKYPFFTCSRETYKIDVAVFSGKAVIVAGNGDLNVKYFDGRFNAYQRTYVLQVANEGLLDAQFLFHFMDVYVSTLRANAQGSTIQYLKKAQFTDAPISLPPLSEQKRIVDLLAAVDTYIAALQRKAANARAARYAVLHELLTKGGDNWTEVTIGDIATIVPGKYLPKAEYVEDGDYFVYGSNSIMGKYSKFLIEPPHTVMAAIGAYAGAVRYSPLASWVNNNAFGLLVKPSVLPGYFYLWVNSMLDLSTVVAGTGQPYVQRPALRATKLVLPPIVVQHEIVETMTTLDSAIQATDQAIRAATQLRSGLAESLLSGDHEIPETYDHFLGAA